MTDLSIRTQHNSRTRLLSLPAELLNRIFEYVVGGLYIFPRGRTVWYKEDNPIHDCRFSSSAFAVLRTCHQVYAEAAPMVYSLNTSAVATERDFPRRKFRLVRNIRIMYGAKMKFLYVSKSTPLSKRWRNLRHIELESNLSHANLDKLARARGMSIVELVQSHEGKCVHVELVANDMWRGASVWYK